MPEFVRELLEFQPATWVIAVICVCVWNVCTLLITLLDKRAAQRHERRVPERRFLFFAAALGGVGVLIGFYAAHHKTRKGYLIGGVWALVVLWALVIAAVAVTALI